MVTKSPIDPTFLGVDEEGSETEESQVVHSRRLLELLHQYQSLPPEDNSTERADLLLDISRQYVFFKQAEDAWLSGKMAFDIYVAEGQWEGATQACELLFLAGQPDSLIALAHGVWLAVTYPVDPSLSVALLQHLIEEAAEDSNAVAAAAATAAYVVDLRALPGSHEADSLRFSTGQMLAQAAYRHSQIREQAAFEQWVKTWHWDNPQQFLSRLAEVLESLAKSQWWIDREALRAKLPE